MNYSLNKLGVSGDVLDGKCICHRGFGAVLARDAMDVIG